MGAGTPVGAGAEGGFDVDVAQAWRRFEGNLATHIASMPEGAYITITSAQASPGQRGQRPYVDLVAVDTEQLIGVASLPTYLYSRSPEMAAADSRLHGLGWSEPGKPAADGTVMDYVVDGARDEATSFATTAVATFREVWNVPHPSFLSAWSVDVGGHSSGPVTLSYDGTVCDGDKPTHEDRSRGVPTNSTALPVALRSLHVFCESLGARVDVATVYAVCGEDDLDELLRRACDYAASCYLHAERNGSKRAATRVWLQQARAWTDTADSLRRATGYAQAASGQDRPAKSAGS